MSKGSLPNLLRPKLHSYTHTPLGQADEVELDGDAVIGFNGGPQNLEIESGASPYLSGSPAASASASSGLRDHLLKFKDKRPIAFKVIVATCIALIIILIMAARPHDGQRRHRNRGAEADSAAAAGTAANQWAPYQATSPALGIVAADSFTCSQIGVAILRKGGNAVDSAAATALCQGVVSPASSGLGGGAHIVFYDAATKTAKFIDSRETAPAASMPDMFDADPQLSQDGGKAVATLAELKGIYQLQQAHGLLAWRECTEPAARLAERYEVSAELASMLADSEVVAYMQSGAYPALEALFRNADGSIKRQGDFVTNTKLAHTLDQIGLHGSDYLYETMAPTLAAEVQAAGGVLTVEDLQAYTVLEHEPITVQIMGHTLYSASGSSSGGAAVAGILEFMDGFAQPLASEGLVYNHRLVEAMKNAFAVRLNLADPLFVNTTGPIGALTSKTFMSQLRNAMSDTGVLPLASYGGKFGLNEARRYLPEDHGTSHMVVVDRSGNAVSLTSTVNTYFGSKVVSPSTGIVFNNQMDDFSNSHSANYFGLAPSASNLPGPGKRPLSSMSPSILIDSNSRVRLVGGASGGPRIITATAQVILNTIGRGYDILQAVVSPRLHSQLLPDTVYVEQHQLISGLSITSPPNIAEDLKKRGHNITEWAHSMGVNQFVAIDPDTGYMTAVSDPRKSGRPAAIH